MKLPHANPLPPEARAAVEQALPALQHAAQSLPREHPLWRLFHGAHCATQDALGLQRTEGRTVKRDLRSR